MTHGLQTEEYGAEGRLSEGRLYNGVRTGKMCLTKSLKEMVHCSQSLRMELYAVFEQNGQSSLMISCAQRESFALRISAILWG
jgi:hypothetical protein